MAQTQSLLATLANERMLKLTTTGRKSGQPRTAEIWFVVEGDHLFVQAGEKARTGWLANVRAHPEVGLAIAGTRFGGRATVISDPAEAQRVLALVRRKYWLARVAGWVGSRIGSGIPLRITLEPEG